MANETFTVTETIVLAPGGDTDLDTVIDPGETVRITVHITNNSANPGATVATGLEFSQILNGMTLVDQAGNDINVSPIAFDDSYTAIGNTLLEVGNVVGAVGPQSTVAGHVTDNDLEFFGDTFTISAVQANSTVVGNTITTTSANGGTVTMVVSGAEMGAFTYTSAAGFTGNDSFTYTIRDEGLDGIAGNADDLVSTATVAVTVANQVWYVDNSFVGVSNGTSTNPYTSLAAVSNGAGGAGTGDIIHVATGNADYTGGITLLANQTLHGAGSALTVGGFNLTSAGADATIVNAAGAGVTLATGNTLTGFTVGNTSTFDIANATASSVGNLTISNVVLNGSGGLMRADAGGTITATFDSVSTSAAGANGILLNNVDGSTFTITGATTINDASADGIAISNTQNSTFTFGGKVTILNDAVGANGDGVDLQSNNAGDSTFNFNGGVDITVNGASAFGFRAQSSGVVNILNPNGDNQITSNNGTALFVNPTQFQAALSSVTAGDGGTGDGIHLEGVTGSGVTIGTVNIAGVGGDGVEILNTAANVTIGAGSIGTGDDPAGDGVNVTGGTGAVSIGASITKTTAGNVVDVSNHETGNVTFSGTLSATGGVNNGIQVTSVNSGTVSFNSTATKVLNTGANTAVNLTANGGATINFSGGALDIDTTSGTGFNATGGGTINVSSANSAITSTTGGAVNLNNVTASFTGGGLDIDSTTGTGFSAAGGGSVAVTGAANSIAAGSGTALNVNGTTIGAADLTFQSIASSGGTANGIMLVNTGNLGGLHVTGTGAAGSGGTIGNKTGGDGSEATIGTGIYLNNTADVQLNNMSLSTFSNFGIRGLQVDGFQLTNSSVNAAGSQTGEGNIAFGVVNGTNGLTGTGTITNTTFNSSFGHGLSVYNTSGTLNLTADNITANSNGDDGIQVRAFGTAQMNTEVKNSDFTSNHGDHFNATADGTSASGMNVLFGTNGSNALSGSSGDGSLGNSVVIQTGGQWNGTANVNVSNNTINFAKDGAINVNAGGSGTVNATISNNTIGTSGVAGSGTAVGSNEDAIRLVQNGDKGALAPAANGGTLNALVANNTIQQVAGRGIYAIGRDGGTGADPIQLNITIQGNTLRESAGATGQGIMIESGASSSPTPDRVTVWADIGVSGAANVFVGDWANGSGDGTNYAEIALRHAITGGNRFILTNYAGGATDNAAVQAYLSANNTGVTGTFVSRNTVFPNTWETAGTPPQPLSAAQFAPLERRSYELDVQAAAEEVGGDPEPVGQPASEPVIPTPPAEAPAGPAPVPDASVIVDDGYLSAAELAFFVDAAEQRWIATGLTAEQRAALDGLTFNIADMGGLTLGLYVDGTVSIDSDGAGRGWFVDLTPLEDGEFANVISATRLTAVAGTPAAGRFDVLTTIMHEMGHALGLGDEYGAEARDTLLYGYLFAGERRLPGDEADGATPGTITHEAFAGSVIEVVPDDGSSVAQDNLFDLPPGRTVTIQWDAIVDGQTNQLIVNPTNSGTVTADNFPSQTSNVVTTALDTLTLGDRVFVDANGNNAYDAGEGVAGVALQLYADTDSSGGWNAGDALLASTTTAASGIYSFTGLAPGNYTVVVTAANFGAGQPLQGKVSIAGGNDPDDDVDNDDNGVAATGGAFASPTITLAYNTEPTANDTNATLDFGFVQPNQAPVNTVPGAQAINEDATRTFNAGNGNAISVSDADAGAGSLTATLTAAHGTLTLSGTAGLTFTTGDGTADATIVFSGTVAAINNALNGLVYTPNADFNGIDTLTLTTNDNGNTGVDPGLTGGPTDEQDSDTVTINITAINDAPVVAGDGTESAATIAEDTSGAGQTVSSLFSGQYSDAADNQLPGGGASSPGAFSGIAVVANGSSGATGQWQYFDSNTSSWVDIGARTTASALLIGSGTLVRFNPTTDFNGAAPTLTAHLIDNSLPFGITFGQTADLTGATGGTTAYSTGTVVLSQAVTAVNDAPVNGVLGAVSAVEDDVGVVLSTTGLAMSVSDVEATGLVVYSLSVSNGTLTIRDDVPGGIDASHIQVLAGTGNGTAVINIAATLSQINTTLAASNGLLYTPDADFNGSDTLAVYLNDGGQSGLDPNPSSLLEADSPGIGAATEEDFDTRTITVTAVDDAPVARADAVTTAENAVGGGSLFADNGSGADVDVDGPALSIAAVNGVGANVGTQITLASGALLTVNADGSYSYDPNGAYDYLISSATAAATGALNASASDSFSYTLAGGNTASVTVTVTGVDGAGDQLRGGAGNDSITGTVAGAVFNLSQGGEDSATGQGGNDGFYMGAALSASDVLDGGAGSLDQLGLQGNYGAPFVFSAGHLTNIEMLVLLSGSDARFGDTSGASYSYTLKTIDANVGAGEQLAVSFNTLQAGESVTFDGSDESDGWFLTFGGLGSDTLTGGAQSDRFYFGNNGLWGAGDSVDGGAGSLDQLGLQGSYTVAFGAGQLAGIEMLVLLTGGDTRFGNPAGTGYSYAVTMDDGNVAAGQMFYVSANTLRAGVPGVSDETLAFDGSGESDGRFTIYSGAGDDTLTGGDQDDTIYGAGGADAMTGGLGNDTFAYIDAAHSSAAAMDQILDFGPGDRINLAAIDAVAGGANNAFTFIGGAAFGNIAGQLRAFDTGGGVWHVEGDIDGNGSADLVIAVTPAAPLIATDFIL